MPPRLSGTKLTEGEAAAAALCDGSLTVREIGRKLGISFAAAHSAIMRAALKLDRDLPYKRSQRGPWRLSYDPTEPVGSLEERPGCGRCGLTGDHECMQGIDHYASAGASNLGQVGGKGGGW